MKRSFTSLALTVCALLFAPSAQSQAPQPAGPLRIVDSTSNVVGPLIDLEGGGFVVTTVIHTGSLRFWLGVRKSSLFSYNSTNTIYFLLTNCQGQPYAVAQPSDSELFLDFVNIIGPAWTVYAPVSGATAAGRTWLSYLDNSGNCTTPGPPFGSAPLVEVAKVVDLRAYFTPPFALQEVVAPTTTASVPMLGWPELALLSLLIVATLFLLRRKGRAKPAS